MQQFAVAQAVLSSTPQDGDDVGDDRVGDALGVDVVGLPVGATDGVEDVGDSVG